MVALEFARNVLNLKDADSTEFNPETKTPIISLLPEQFRGIEMGGTLRLGLNPCKVKEGTKAYSVYQKTDINERHRHRYEFNNQYLKTFEEHGMIASGKNPDKDLVEILELKNHPWYLACQFHPEFLSRPYKAHPLFKGFIKASLDYKNEHLKTN